MMARKKKQTRGPKTYGSYLFKDKDPVIDETRTLIEDSFGGRITNKMLAEIEKNGGPTVTCMRGWFFGEIKRPNNVTIEAAGRAIGFKRAWVKMK